MWIDGTLDVSAMLQREAPTRHSQAEHQPSMHNDTADLPATSTPSGGGVDTATFQTETEALLALEQGGSSSTNISDWDATTSASAALPNKRRRSSRSAGDIQQSDISTVTSSSYGSGSESSILGAGTMTSADVFGAASGAGLLGDVAMGGWGLGLGTSMPATESVTAASPPVTNSISGAVAPTSSQTGSGSEAQTARATRSSPAIPAAAKAKGSQVTQSVSSTVQPLKAARKRGKASDKSSDTLAAAAHPIVDDSFLLAAAAAAEAAPILPPTSTPVTATAADIRGGSSGSASAPLLQVQRRAFSSTRLLGQGQGLEAAAADPAAAVAEPATAAAQGGVTAAASQVVEASPEEAGQQELQPRLPFLDPYTTPIEALVVRVDKATGEVDVQRVVSLPTAFSAFLAALRLHEVLKIFPSGGSSGAAAPSSADVSGPLLERVARVLPASRK
jgi:hypothetical protein